MAEMDHEQTIPAQPDAKTVPQSQLTVTWLCTDPEAASSLLSLLSQIGHPTQFVAGPPSPLMLQQWREGLSLHQEAKDY